MASGRKHSRAGPLQRLFGPASARQSRHADPADLIIAEGPVGGPRKRRLPPFGVRVARSMTFLLSCLTSTAVIGIIVYNVDKTDLPSQSGAAVLWQAFESTMGFAVVVAAGMWLVHLATTVIVNRVRRMRASEGVSFSALAGAMAYPFYLAFGAGVDLFRSGATPRGALLSSIGLVVPSVIATLLAPVLIRSSSGRT